jgi:psp operon transcriptional activator
VSQAPAAEAPPPMRANAGNAGGQAAGSAGPDALPDGGFADATRAFEARLLRQALEACRFNQAEAARRLGLSYYQFRHHLRVHGMLPGNADKAPQGGSPAENAAI